MRTKTGFSKPVSKDTGRAAGFSLIEVSVVVVISLILSFFDLIISFVVKWILST